MDQMIVTQFNCGRLASIEVITSWVPRVPLQRSGPVLRSQPLPRKAQTAIQVMVSKESQWQGDANWKRRNEFVESSWQTDPANSEIGMQRDVILMID
jgi:hypothetical protein